MNWSSRNTTAMSRPAARVGEQRLGEPEGRRAPQHQADLGDDAGALDGRGHRPGPGGVDGERLLAEDVHAPRGGGVDQARRARRSRCVTYTASHAVEHGVLASRPTW